MEQPTREEALALLDWAHELNPGPWREHSLGVGRICQTLANELGLDAQRAYLSGMLHDIGRYEGVRHMHHVIAGYELLMEKGWDIPARACITHSFPDGNIEHYSGRLDVTEEEYARIKRLLKQFVPDDYDRMVQLADAISWGSGACLMEKRLVNVALRYGTEPGVTDKWRACFAIKDEFERRMGKSVYSLFPEAAQNTLG